MEIDLSIPPKPSAHSVLQNNPIICYHCFYLLSKPEYSETQRSLSLCWVCLGSPPYKNLLFFGLITLPSALTILLKTVELKIMRESQQVWASEVGGKEESVPKVSSGEWLRDWWGKWKYSQVWSGSFGRIEYFGVRNICLVFI